VDSSANRKNPSNRAGDVRRNLQMTGHGAKFGRKRDEAIIALLTHRNVEEAAKSIGVAPKTLFRWMQVPEFDAAYRKSRRDAFRQSVARLQQASGAAVTALIKLAVDPNAPAAVRARAAYYILTLATKAMETEEIEARVSALEQAAELSKQVE
jgi:hypothetical protein